MLLTLKKKAPKPSIAFLESFSNSYGFTYVMMTMMIMMAMTIMTIVMVKMVMIYTAAKF